MKQYAVRIALGLAVLAAFLGHAAKVYRMPFVNQLDRIIYDTRLRLTMPRDEDERIVFVASRSTHARRSPRRSRCRRGS